MKPGRASAATDPTTVVRLVAPGDALPLVRALAASRDHLEHAFATNWEQRIDVDSQRQRIVKSLADHAAGRAWPGIILDGRTGDVLGRIALQDIVLDNRRSCFLSYWLAASAVGRGHATRAAIDILAIAFSDLRLHRVEAFVRPANTASLGVVARCGFERIGIARRHIFVGGDWCDEVLFQKLAPWDDAGVLVPPEA